MRNLVAAMAIVLVLTGCNPNGSSPGPSKIPEPAKVPALRSVKSPKNVQPLQLKPVQGPSAVRPVEVRASNGPKPVQPHTAQLKSAEPYKPNSGKSAYQPINARGAAAQQLLEQKK